jgi:dihydrofolate reductase
MPIVTCDMGVSVDGFVAGPNQTLEHPLGEGGVDRLHRWMFEDADANAPEIEAITNAGAYIMGRNMFGPGRKEWDTEWKGWWGEDPPYHAPVFVLTHYPRPPLKMQGGTTFNFVTDGVESAMAQARKAAGDKDISIAGGASVVNQFLQARLIDELRLHIAPLLIGKGERLFVGVENTTLELLGARTTKYVTHLNYRILRH